MTVVGQTPRRLATCRTLSASSPSTPTRSAAASATAWRVTPRGDVPPGLRMSISVASSCTTHKGTGRPFLVRRTRKASGRMLSTPQLLTDLTGQVLTPKDQAYDEARMVFAAHIDRRPAVIARVAGPDDIARVIAGARAT